MGMKFLNKKGWHTGSLRNIETVWKAEQKHNEEEKKLEELRKQIHEERERSEFRLLQEKAGLVPKQERLDFMYESGLGVGKASASDGFNTLEPLPPPKATDTTAAATSSKAQPLAPGALFEDKPQSANDAWRKLHSDPLLLIRQQEQAALARIKKNPVQMAIIRKSVEEEKHSKEKRSKKEHKSHNHKKSKHDKHISRKTKSDSDDASRDEKRHRKRTESKGSKFDKRSHNRGSDSEADAKEEENHKLSKQERRSSQISRTTKDSAIEEEEEGRKRTSDSSRYGRRDRYNKQSDDFRERSFHQNPKREKHYHSETKGNTVDRDSAIKEQEGRKRTSNNSRYERRDRYDKQSDDLRESEIYQNPKHEKPYHSEMKGDAINALPAVPRHSSRPKQQPKLSEEEKAARLREMQLDAELHEENRWKRLKKASENDAREAAVDSKSEGRGQFLDAAKKTMYGAEKGGSSTIEESVRRGKYYMQRQSGDTEGNAFRR